MSITITAPTTQQLIKHLEAGGHIKYASIQHANDTTSRKLISTDSTTEFYYSIKDANTISFKRFKFGKLVPVNFPLQFIELLSK